MKLYIICSRIQRVNLHARPSIIQVGVPPVVIRCVHWTIQRWVLQTCINPQSPTIVMTTKHNHSSVTCGVYRCEALWTDWQRDRPEVNTLNINLNGPTTHILELHSTIQICDWTGFDKMNKRKNKHDRPTYWKEEDNYSNFVKKNPWKQHTNIYSGHLFTK